MNKQHRTLKHGLANGPTSESLVWLLLASVAMAAVGLALAQMLGLLG